MKSLGDILAVASGDEWKWKPLPLEMIESDYIAFEMYRRHCITLDEFMKILERLESERKARG
jgi:hypothetical protein